MSISAAPEESTRDAVRARLAEMVHAACDRSVSAADIAAWPGPLASLGVNSLAQLRLVDSVESEFGIYLDLDGSLAFLSTLDTLADHLVKQLGQDGM